MDIERLVDYGIPTPAVGILKKDGISRLNPLQVEAIRKGVFEGKNIVVVAPTASGKTLIGELAIIRAITRGGMGVFLVPLRALASEKYESFKKWEALGYRVGITTGDYESPGEQLGRNDIIVATYERFDSILRLKPSWLKRVRVVVVDELHMVGDMDRGPVLEMVLARLLNRNIQIIGLSATIGNPDELAKWLNARLVTTPWRPVKLVEGVFDKAHYRIVFYDDGKERIEKVNSRLENPALSIALHSITRGMQVLVFVNNRRRAEEWAEKITDHLNLMKHMVPKDKLSEILGMLRESPSSGERERLSRLLSLGVAYHHAGLSSIARKVVEKAFRDRAIRIVFATPTLAAGVNLPARRVLVSVKRYDPTTRRMVGIPVFEYKQMAGRAGRPQYDPQGEAVIYDASSLREGLRYIKNDPEPVESKLSNERSLRIHLLSLIVTGEARNIRESLRIFSKTLFNLQYGSIRQLKDNLSKTVNELRQWGMIKGKEVYEPTLVGSLTSITYLDPLSTHRFLKLVENRIPGTLYLLHSIALTPDYSRSKPYISWRILNRLEDEAYEFAQEHLVPSPIDNYASWLEAYGQARMLSDWVNEASEDEISKRYNVGPGDIYSARDKASWISGALSRITGRVGRIALAERLERLSLRLEYGVREDALQLVKLEGIGRVRARTLIAHGIRSLEELAVTPPEKLLSLPGFGRRLVARIYDQLRHMGYAG